MKAALYLRVSTGEQTTENQRLELERVADLRKWSIVKVYADDGISGAKGRDKRPGFNALCTAAARHEFDVVMAWSVDRISRSLQDLITFMNDLNAQSVQLYLHQQALDTTTPSGRLMFQLTGAFAEYEREIIRGRIRAGLARAKSEGVQLGRESVITPELITQAAALKRQGAAAADIARSLKVSVRTVWRLLKLATPTASYLE